MTVDGVLVATAAHARSSGVGPAEATSLTYRVARELGEEPGPASLAALAAVFDVFGSDENEEPA